MGVMLPSNFKNFAQKIWNFTVRKDDIWIVTYPKCGTTLTQEIMWQIGNINQNSKYHNFVYFFHSKWTWIGR